MLSIQIASVYIILKCDQKDRYGEFDYSLLLETSMIKKKKEKGIGGFCDTIKLK